MGDHPIFGDESLAESTGHRVAPHDRTTSGRDTLEVALVGTPEGSLPGRHSVRPVHENLDFDLEIREGTLIHAEDASNRTVTTCHLVVREVGDMSGVKNSPMASTFPLTIIAELAASIFDASDCPIRASPGLRYNHADTVRKRFASAESE